MQLDMVAVRESVRRALREDLGDAGDLTTEVSGVGEQRKQARIIARSDGFLAGVAIAEECFRACDPDVEVAALQDDGDRITSGVVVMIVTGKASALLAAERTALNYMQRLSGIATRTGAFVAAIAGTGARIFDTRKTTPGMRAFEKYAVAVGGGVNHRFGLFDQVLLKENHFALTDTVYEEVVQRAVAQSRGVVIAEARNVLEACAAVCGGAGVVLLDNFSPGPELRSAVKACRAQARELGREVEIEASGGVSLKTVRRFAECGVDRISVGALTHSVEALDVSMLIGE